MEIHIIWEFLRSLIFQNFQFLVYFLKNFDKSVDIEATGAAPDPSAQNNADGKGVFLRGFEEAD